MNRSMPGLPVHHQLPEFTQTHVYPVGDAIQSYHPLLYPYPPTPNSSKHRVFSNESTLFAWGGQSTGVSASASDLPVNTQDWSPLGSTGWISLQSKGLSKVFSNITIQKHPFFGTQFLHRPILTSIHDHWKNHSLNQTDLCWQSNVLLFNMLSRLVITFLSRSKLVLISWLQSPSAVILEPPKNKVCHCFFPLSPILFPMRWWDQMPWS